MTQNHFNLEAIKRALEYHWKHQDKVSYDVLKEKVEGFEKQEREKQKRDIDVLYEKFKIARKTMKPSALSDDFSGFVVGYAFRGREILGNE